MIKVAKLTDYAIALLAAMIKDAGGDRKKIFTASGLSVRTNIPAATVTKVLKMLTKADMIRSQRGTKGGYTLNQGTHAVSIGEVIQALEGSILVSECVKTCYARHHCPFVNAWTHVNDAVRDLLSRYRIKDMMDGKKPAQKKK